MTNVLVTGGSGFVGIHLMNEILRRTDWKIYSLGRRPLKGPLNGQRVKHFFHDLNAPVPVKVVSQLEEAGGVSHIIHAAGEVSGINSLSEPVKTVQTNVLSAYYMLEIARYLCPCSFVYVSTGEVVGNREAGAAPESTPLYPSNPYAASKAASEALALSYWNTYNVPVSIIRVMNLFGPGQDVRRFVPTAIKKILADEKIQCHTGLDGTVGSRNWMHVKHFVRELLTMLHTSKLENGKVYHLVGPELNNEQVIQVLAGGLERGYWLEKVAPGPSHDLRYSLAPTNVFEMNLMDDLVETARWYEQNRWCLNG